MQIAQDDAQRYVRSNGDNVNVHQAAGAVFIVGQNLVEALAVKLTK